MKPKTKEIKRHYSKRVNSSDLTLRNLRAARKRMEKLEKRLVEVLTEVKKLKIK